ncbi:MAG: alpha-amylase family glycosyl hydrolase [Opitutales bacterium]|nr:alpha-amylase family glycosyl hydrolase [Opitutales bacterium]
MRLLRLVLLVLSVALHAPLARAASPAPDPYQPVPYVKLQHPEWSKNATIYQLNTRQFTAEGTFRAAERELPRLKALNVDIVWLMPIHPIGQQNRKGALGSPYAVRDYLGVNPEFGTLEDLRHLVATAHALGLHVILDWVANHTAWDNPLAAQHPDWYQKNWKGDFTPTPWFDWSDIINLDYRQPGLRRYMTEALKYWVREAGVDGYRCDVAGYVPLDFWNNARRELDAIKSVFMLAEWESRDLHAEAFDMTYAWSWYEAMTHVAKGTADVGALCGYYSWNEGFFPRDIMRMTFTSNHDKNSWEGTAPEQFGDAFAAATVLSVVGEGLPLLYNSQEAGETKRLKFFEKDSIVWGENLNAELYRRLFALKHANTALWNAHWGARMIQVTNTAPNAVLSFIRRNEHDAVFAVFNFSKTTQTVKFNEAGLFQGRYQDYFGGEQVELGTATELSLKPWAYRVLVAAPR